VRRHSQRFLQKPALSASEPAGNIKKQVGIIHEVPACFYGNFF
jgi:hypothetical protein